MYILKSPNASIKQALSYSEAFRLLVVLDVSSGDFEYDGFWRQFLVVLAVRLCE